MNRAAILLTALLVVTPFDDRQTPITPAEAVKRRDQKVVVRMKVQAAKERLAKHGEIYLDSETDFHDPKNLGVVITRDGAAKFRPAGIEEPAVHFKGQTIQVTGTVIIK